METKDLPLVGSTLSCEGCIPRQTGKEKKENLHANVWLIAYFRSDGKLVPNVVRACIRYFMTRCFIELRVLASSSTVVTLCQLKLRTLESVLEATAG